MHAPPAAASPTANPVGADMEEVPRLRLTNLRARGLAGALLSTSMLAVVPAIAISDTQSPAAVTTAAAPAVATATVTAKASSTLSVSSVRRTVVAGRALVVRGVLRPAGAGRAVALQIRRE